MIHIRSEYLSKDRFVQALEALPAALKTLLGEAEVIAYYGFGCQLHADLLYKPMRVHTGWLDRFIQDSLQQGIVVPGRSDFDFTVPENRLSMRFCHECDMHISGDDATLWQRLSAMSPFSGLTFEVDAPAEWRE